MKHLSILVTIVVILNLTSCANMLPNKEKASEAQTETADGTMEKPTNSFSKMTEKEKGEYVNKKIDEITLKISDKKYPFDSDFKSQVLSYVETYSKRVGNGKSDAPFAEDLKVVLERGSKFAPTINSAFDEKNVSRLVGLYLAMIESEFDEDLQSPTGPVGLFQLASTTARKYGTDKNDRTDPKKSAKIAARQIADNQLNFPTEKMKELLAVLSHNRGFEKVSKDLSQQFMEDFDDCSICGLTQNASKLDEQFQNESVKVIPKFLAAAIVGENPKDFGLNTKPLSTLTVDSSQQNN